jgi:Xaa-Pro aminopeptidase
VNQALQRRIERLRESLASRDLDALLVLIAENRRYLSGFTGEDNGFDESAGALIVGAERLVLATDSRFEIQARHEAPGFDVVVYTRGLTRELAQMIQPLGVRRLGVESRRISLAWHAEILEALASAGLEVEVVPVEEMVEPQRAVKSAEEIAATRAALRVAEAVFSEITAKLQPGMTEKQIAQELEGAARQAGADAMSFPTIVAAGPNSALPHAIPGDRPVAAGDPLLIDWGVRLDGYCSDTTRTFVLGEPDKEFRRIYKVVRQAQQMATEAIRPGATGRQVDAVARHYIGENGFGDKFGHGLGHGTGLAIHEAPRLSPLSDAILESGMIVTVEPGIYIEGWGGIRLENQVVVTDSGAEVLNGLPFLFE